MPHTKLLAITCLSFVAWSSTAAAIDAPEQREPQRVVVGELRQVDELIAVTKSSLIAQQQLREMLGAYQHTKEVVLNDPRDNEALYRQSLMAKRILDQIENNHFDHLFSREFLSELHLFAKVANKHLLPRS